jgi:hypothetical protein
MPTLWGRPTRYGRGARTWRTLARDHRRGAAPRAPTPRRSTPGLNAEVRAPGFHPRRHIRPEAPSTLTRPRHSGNGKRRRVVSETQAAQPSRLLRSTAVHYSRSTDHFSRPVDRFPRSTEAPIRARVSILAGVDSQGALSGLDQRIEGSIGWHSRVQVHRPLPGSRPL